MAATQSPYRPHNPGHDYYEAGAYLITLVVGEREHILSSLNDDAKQPEVVLSQVGRIVHEEWEKTEAIQCGRGRLIETRCQVCMPDHWHGVIIVKERMDRSLGYVIQCFKSACTARWRREVTGYVEPKSSSTLIRSISVKKRAAYYATRPRIERPLFDDDYDDTICLDERHLRAMVAYVGDNPRRAIIRRLLPQFMQRCLHVMIGGHDYAAFGNLFLLRWPKRVQVFCHRKARLAQLNAEERRAMYGEKWTEDKAYCLKARAYNQNAEKGLNAMGAVGNVPAGTDYARFHNLNLLAEQLCAYDGEARVLSQPIGG